MSGKKPYRFTQRPLGPTARGSSLQPRLGGESPGLCSLPQRLPFGHQAAREEGGRGEGKGWLTQPVGARRSGAERPGTVQLMIIINTEQTLAGQPAGSGKTPGSPTARLKNKTHGSQAWGREGGDKKEGTGQCQEVGWGSLPCERVGRGGPSWQEISAYL